MPKKQEKNLLHRLAHLRRDFDKDVIRFEQSISPNSFQKEEFFALARKTLALLYNMGSEYTYEELLKKVEDLGKTIALHDEELKDIKKRINSVVVEAREKGELSEKEKIEAEENIGSLQQQMEAVENKKALNRQLELITTKSNLKNYLTVFCRKMSELEYGEDEITFKDLQRAIQQLKEVVYIATEDAKKERETVLTHMMHVIDEMFSKKKKAPIPAEKGMPALAHEKQILLVMHDLLSQAHLALKDEDKKQAIELYHEILEKYREVPSQEQTKFYEEINRIYPPKILADLNDFEIHYKERKAAIDAEKDRIQQEELMQAEEDRQHVITEEAAMKQQTKQISQELEPQQALPPQEIQEEQPKTVTERPRLIRTQQPSPAPAKASIAQPAKEPVAEPGPYDTVPPIRKFVVLREVIKKKKEAFKPEPTMSAAAVEEIPIENVLIEEKELKRIEKEQIDYSKMQIKTLLEEAKKALDDIDMDLARDIYETLRQKSQLLPQKERSQAYFDILDVYRPHIIRSMRIIRRMR
jgi:hypothetical protein